MALSEFLKREMSSDTVSSKQSSETVPLSSTSDDQKGSLKEKTKIGQEDLEDNLVNLDYCEEPKSEAEEPLRKESTFSEQTVSDEVRTISAEDSLVDKSFLIGQQEWEQTNNLLQAMEKQVELLSEEVRFLRGDIRSSSRPDAVILEKLTGVETATREVMEKQDHNDRQLTNTLRQNANFQVQVRQGMQQDLDALKMQQAGEQFTPILKELADIYAGHKKLLELPQEESLSEQSWKSLNMMFEQLEDLLLEYGAEIFRSEAGEVRRARFTKIIDKIPTHEEGMHNHIAASRRPGVAKENLVLTPEYVDVYVYDPSAKPEPNLENNKNTMKNEGEI